MRLYGRQKGFTRYTNNLTYIRTRKLSGLPVPGVGRESWPAEPRIDVALTNAGEARGQQNGRTAHRLSFIALATSRPASRDLIDSRRS